MPPRDELIAWNQDTPSLSFDDAPPLSIIPVEEEAEGTKRSLSSRRLLKALSLTVGVYACLSLVFFVFPRLGTRVLGSVPWIGPLVLQDHRLNQRLVLAPLSATFETLKDNKTVLVISGVATNKNAQSLADIEIEGRLYDAQGRELSHEVISGGNALSRKILRDLTAKDVSLLQPQKARKQFEIPPRESIEFVVVFLSPNRNATQFNARVIRARSVG